MDREAWRAAVHEVTKSQTQLSNWTELSQSYGLSSSHIWMWELNYKESWALKIWCFWTVVLEKTLESTLDCKEIKPVNLKGNQSWILIGMTDSEAETPILWPPDVKNWLIGKVPDTQKDRRQEEKGMTEVKMVGWHHQLDGHEFEQTPSVADGQGGLVCCSPWGHKDSDMTAWVNWMIKDNLRGFPCLMERDKKSSYKTVCYVSSASALPKNFLEMQTS